MSDRITKHVSGMLEYGRKPYLVAKNTVAKDQTADYYYMMKTNWSQAKNDLVVQSVKKKPYQEQDYKAMEQVSISPFDFDYPPIVYPTLATVGATTSASESGWVAVSNSVSGHNFGIYNIIVFNNEIYGVPSYPAVLLKWNGSNAWVQVAEAFDDKNVYSLAVHNSKLYGGTDVKGNLVEFNGTNAWAVVAPKLTATFIYSLASFNNKLYGGTGLDTLYEWNDVNAWVEVAAKVPAVDTDLIVNLQVLNGKLYGIERGSYGKLLEWNGTNAWAAVSGSVGSPGMFCGIVFDGEIYAGHEDADLYKWNGTNAWAAVSGAIGISEVIKSLVVLNGELYGVTGTTGILLKYDGSGVWVNMGSPLGSGLNSLCVLGGSIYGAGLNTVLYKWV